MRSEVLLYGYGAICLCMILFNLSYTTILRRSDKRLKKSGEKLMEEIRRQLVRLAHGEPVQTGHKEKMRRVLGRVKNLLALNQVLEQTDRKILAAYLQEMQDVLQQLAEVYLRRNNLQAAFFSWFFARYAIWEYGHGDKMENCIIGYVRKDDFYCKVNGMRALCSFAAPAAVERALELQDRSGLVLHEKVLTEILLQYKGDHEALIGLLWARFDVFSLQTRESLLNYIRFRSGNWKDEMFAIMTDPEQNKELRISAVRYFSRYPDERACEALMKMTLSEDSMEWEAAAVSATALGSYKGEESKKVLIKAMSSPNWYIRYNAACSLVNRGLQYEQLPDIIRGDDRYAREMLMYRLEEQARREEEEENE